MNDRIKELASCNDRIQTFFETGPVQRAAIEEFAELIVRECIANCDDLNSMKYIASHFGVEIEGLK
jgi:hypothetical protein